MQTIRNGNHNWKSICHLPYESETLFQQRGVGGEREVSMKKTTPDKTKKDSDGKYERFYGLFTKKPSMVYQNTKKTLLLSMEAIQFLTTASFI